MIYNHAHNWPIFKAVPVLRILIPLLIGIILNLVEVNSWSFVLVICCAFFICLVVYLALFNSFNKQLVFYFAMITLGYLHTITHRENFYLNHFSKFSIDSSRVIVNSIPEVKDKSIKIFADVTRVGKANSCGKILLYIKKDSASLSLKYGDELSSILKYRNIEKIPNSKFDYKQYLANKQVYQQAYLKSNEWKLTARCQGSYFTSLAYHYRQQCHEVLKKSFCDLDAYAVSSALLIGDDDDISKSVYQAYTDSGTLHVLSVSGMHVGVIYILLVTLFGRLERNKYTKHFYFLLMLILIWMYSILSGSSASVFRAATMLTVVIIGKWINGNSPIYNSLVLSMFALLLYNPFYLTDKGFILSYLAVYGIVYLQPKIISLWRVKNKYGYKLWEFTTVSIAAQIMTLPISLFLFGKFPNYFILANWVVIPLSTIAIYLSIAQIVFQKWNIVFNVITFCNEKVIRSMNEFLQWLTKIKGAVTNNIEISSMQCILLYFILFVLVDWLTTKRFSSLMMFLIGYASVLALIIANHLNLLQFT